MAYSYGKTTYGKDFNGNYVINNGKYVYQVRLGYQVNSQDIALNKSNVSLRLEVRSVDSNYKTYGYQQQTTIDGTFLGAHTYDLRSTNVWQVFGTKTFDVSHNQDGTYSAKKSGYFGTNAAGTGRLVSGSAEVQMALPTIARASTIGVINANIGSSTTITINKANNDFTTTLSYKASGQNSWTQIISKTSQTSYAWTVPTSFYALIPNSKNISCEFQAETYSGDTLIGTTNTTATFTATGSPLINSATTTDTNATTTALTGDSAKMVKYASNVQVSVNVSAQNSATISSVKVNGNAITISGGTGSITFNGSSTNSFTIEVLDSRGYTTTTTKTMTMVNYVPLTLNATMSRYQPTDGLVDISFSGNYFNSSFGSSNNSLTVQYRYKENGGSFGNWTNLTTTLSNNTYSGSTQISNIDYTKIYYFEIQAIDEIQTKKIENIVITKGQPIFYWDDDEFGVNGKTTSTKGFISMDKGNVGTPTTDGNLVIKRANNTECPNNGVVLEYGGTSGWCGQLYIGDNATQGVYFNGWSSGTRGTWHRLAQDDWFNDTAGSDWQTMMKNKIDWCVSNIRGTGTTYEAFINGGWANKNYGFGLYSRIGSAYQLVWFSSYGTYYCRIQNGTYTYRKQDAETETGTGIVSRSSGATLNSSSYAKFGNVITLDINLTSSGTTNTGSNAFKGTINNSTFYPKVSAGGTSYNGSTGLLGYIDTSGNITIRVIGANFSSGKDFSIVFTYVI